jgi:hypothetical protein
MFLLAGILKRIGSSSELDCILMARVYASQLLAFPSSSASSAYGRLHCYAKLSTGNARRKTPSDPFPGRPDDDFNSMSVETRGGPFFERSVDGTYHT